MVKYNLVDTLKLIVNMENMNKHIMVTPTLELNIRSILEFDNIKQFRGFINEKRVGVKQAVNYPYDNTHTYLTHNGKRVIQISIFDAFVSLWSSNEYDSFALPDIFYKENQAFTYDDVKLFETYARNIIDGNQWCCRSLQWYPKSEMKQLGYAGRVHQSVFKVGDDVVDSSG